MQELERRAASVIIQAFDDSSTIIGKLKLFDSFGNLLEREILHSELQKKQKELLEEYLADVAQVCIYVCIYACVRVNVCRRFFYIPVRKRNLALRAAKETK